MAKKYYAVAKGKTPGIYLTWDDCKMQVHGFSGAIYKSFATMQEAEDFMKNATGANIKTHNSKKKPVNTTDKNGLSNVSNTRDISAVSTSEHLIAYVDGSYDHKQRRYAYGCVMILPECEITLNGSDNQEDYIEMRNVAGEILGSEQAILWAIGRGYPSITIYYDYEGIEKWANNIWKANKPGTQRYKSFIAEKRKKIDIAFQKVAAHTGVKYNEMADRLAKEALGLR